MATILTDAGEHVVPEAEAAGDSLWMPAGAAGAVTGWAYKPEGFCRDAMCVPVPPGRESDIVQGSCVNVAGLWRHLGQVVVNSHGGDAWVLGGSARERAAALASLEAPDFTLPDVAGRPHSLSDHRGRKVLLVTWASW
jgi:hypothetical protein